MMDILVMVAVFMIAFAVGFLCGMGYILPRVRECREELDLEQKARKKLVKKYLKLKETADQYEEAVADATVQLDAAVKDVKEINDKREKKPEKKEIKKPVVVKASGEDLDKLEKEVSDLVNEVDTDKNSDGD